MSDNDLLSCTNSLATIMVVINHRNIPWGPRCLQTYNILIYRIIICFLIEWETPVTIEESILIHLNYLQNVHAGHAAPSCRISICRVLKKQKQPGATNWYTCKLLVYALTRYWFRSSLTVHPSWTTVSQHHEWHIRLPAPMPIATSSPIPCSH